MGKKKDVIRLGSEKYLRLMRGESVRLDKKMVDSLNAYFSSLPPTRQINMGAFMRGAQREAQQFEVEQAKAAQSMAVAEALAKAKPPELPDIIKMATKDTEENVARGYAAERKSASAEDIREYLRAQAYGKKKTIEQIVPMLPKQTSRVPMPISKMITTRESLRDMALREVPPLSTNVYHSPEELAAYDVKYEQAYKRAVAKKYYKPWEGIKPARSFFTPEGTPFYVNQLDEREELKQALVDAPWWERKWNLAKWDVLHALNSVGIFASTPSIYVKERVAQAEVHGPQMADSAAAQLVFNFAMSGGTILAYGGAMLLGPDRMKDLADVYQQRADDIRSGRMRAPDAAHDADYYESMSEKFRTSYQTGKDNLDMFWSGVKTSWDGMHDAKGETDALAEQFLKKTGHDSVWEAPFEWEAFKKQHYESQMAEHARQEQVYLSKASEAYNTAAQKAAAMGINDIQTAQSAGLFRDAIQFQKDAIKNRILSDYGSAFNAYTWASEPEKYDKFLDAAATMELQMGRALTEAETRRLKDYYTNIWTEMFGESLYDPTILFPSELAQKTIGAGVKVFKVGGQAVRTKVPLLDNAINFLTRKTAPSIASRMEADIYNTLARASQGFQKTEDFKTALYFFSENAETVQSAEDFARLMSKDELKGFGNITYSDFRRWRDASSLGGIDPTKWGELFEKSMDEAESTFATQIRLRLIQNGMSEDDALVEAARLAKDRMADAKNAPRYLDSYAQKFSSSFMDTQRVAPKSNLYKGTISGWIGEQAHKLAVNDAAKEGMRIFGRTSYNALSAMVQVGAMGRNLWTMAVLNLNPGRIVRNIIDSMFRDVVYGGNVFGDIDTLLRSTHAEFADALGFIPLEMGQSLARQGLDFTDQVMSRILYEDWKPTGGILSYWQYEFNRLREKGGTGFLTKGDVAKTVINAMPPTRSKALMAHMWDGARTVVSDAGSALWAIPNAMADYNTAVEFTLRLRMFHREYFGMLDQIEPLFKARGMEALSSEAKEIARRAWIMSGSNPQQLGTYIDNLLGEAEIRGRPEWDFLLPDNFGSGLPMDSSEKASYIYMTKSRVGKFIRETRSATGRNPSAVEIKNFIRELKGDIENEVQIFMAQAMEKRRISELMNTTGELSAEIGADDLDGSAPILAGLTPEEEARAQKALSPRARDFVKTQDLYAAKGQPLVDTVVYRGRSPRGPSDPGDLGIGMYHSTSRSVAKSYGKVSKQTLNLDNVLELTADEAKELAERYKTLTGTFDERAKGAKRLTDDLQAAGYDGVRVKGWDGPPGSETFLVFPTKTDEFDYINQIAAENKVVLGDLTDDAAYDTLLKELRQKQVEARTKISRRLVPPTPKPEMTKGTLGVKTPDILSGYESAVGKQARIEYHAGSKSYVREVDGQLVISLADRLKKRRPGEVFDALFETSVDLVAEKSRERVAAAGISSDKFRKLLRDLISDPVGLRTRDIESFILASSVVEDNPRLWDLIVGTGGKRVKLKEYYQALADFDKFGYTTVDAALAARNVWGQSLAASDEAITRSRGAIVYIAGDKLNKESGRFVYQFLPEIEKTDGELASFARGWINVWDVNRKKYEEFLRLSFPGPQFPFASREFTKVLWDRADEMQAAMYDVERGMKVELRELMMSDPEAAREFMKRAQSSEAVSVEFLERNGYKLTWDEDEANLISASFFNGTEQQELPFYAVRDLQSAFFGKDAHRVSALSYVDITAQEPVIDQIRHNLQRVYGLHPGTARSMAETIDNQAKWWANATGHPLEEYYSELGFGRMAIHMDMPAEMAKLGVIDVSKEGKVYFLGLKQGDVSELVRASGKWFYRDMRSAAKYNVHVAKDLETINRFLERVSGVPIPATGELLPIHMEKFSDMMIGYIKGGTPPKAVFQRAVEEAAMDGVVVKNAPIGKVRVNKVTGEAKGHVYFKFDKKTNTLTFDRDYVAGLFDKKPWMNLRDKTSLSEGAFRDANEWADFVLRKEKARVVYKKLPGESPLEYGQRLNEIALKTRTSFIERVPGDLRKPFGSFKRMLSLAYDNMAGSEWMNALPDDIVSILDQMSIEQKMRAPRTASRMARNMIKQSGIPMTDDELLRMVNGLPGPVPVKPTKKDIDGLRKMVQDYDGNLDVVIPNGDRVRVVGKQEYPGNINTLNLAGKDGPVLTWEDMFDSQIFDPKTGAELHAPLPPSASPISRSAEQFLESVDARVAHPRMTDELKLIAGENSIPVTDTTTAEEIITSLKQKLEGGKLRYGNVAEIPADEVQRAIAKKARGLGIQFKVPELKQHMDAAWEVYKTRRAYQGFPKDSLKSYDSFKEYLREYIDSASPGDPIAHQFNQYLYDTEQFEAAMMNFHVPRDYNANKTVVKEFDKWFKKSMAIDNEGNPLHFYGTAGDEMGIHLSMQAQPNVEPLVTNIQKPLRIKAGTIQERALNQNPKAVTEFMKGQGYDGVFIYNRRGDLTDVVAFDTNQIRSGVIPPRYNDTELYGEHLFPKIGEYQMDSGVKMWVRNNEKMTSTYVAGLQEIDRLEEYLLGGKFVSPAVPSDVAAELRAWKEIGMQSKSDMVSTAINGGMVGKRSYEGAIHKTNRVMIDYNTQTQFGQVMKNIFPFWVFPSRSWPFWAETLVTHPQIIDMYQKIRHLSEAARYQVGAVTSQGKPMQSLEGYIPIPGTDLWFNPLAPFSFAYVLGMNMSTDDVLYAAQEENDLPPIAYATRQFLETGPIYGFSPAPWVVWGLKKQFNIPDTIMAPWPLIPQISLMPRWMLPDLLERGGRWGSMGQALYPEAPWHDQMVERDMLKDLLAEVENMTASETPSGSARMNAAAMKRVRDVEMAIREKGSNPLWVAAYQRYTSDESSRSWSSFVGGYYTKPFTDAQANLLALRNERTLLKSALNNKFQAAIFNLPLDDQAAWDKYTSLSNTTEGLIYQLYGTAGWVRNEAGELIRDPVQRAKYEAMNLMDQENQRLYYTKASEIRKKYDQMLNSLPIGATYEQKKIVYDWLNSQMNSISELNTYVSRYGTNMPLSMIESGITDRWYFHIQSFAPRWNPEKGETYDEYKQRRAEWERDLPQLAKDYMGSFLERNDVLNTYATLHPDQPLPKDFFATLQNSTDMASLKDWQMTRHTLTEALNVVWEETYWNVYWTDVGSLSGYEREVADARFAEMHPEPTVEQLFTEVQKRYGDRFTFDQVKALVEYNGGDVYNIDERLFIQKGEEFKQRSKIWDLLSWAGPGKNNTAFRARLSPHDSALVDKWFASGGMLWQNDMKSLQSFESTIEGILKELGLTAPTTEQKMEFAKAQEQNKQFQDILSKEFDTDWSILAEVIDLYFNDGYKKFKANRPDDYKFIQRYFDFRTEFGKSNPLWSMYYLGEPGTDLMKRLEEMDLLPPPSSFGLKSDEFPTGNQPNTPETPATPTTTTAPAPLPANPQTNWPKGIQTQLNADAQYQIKWMFQTGKPISPALKTYLKGLGDRHNEWKSWIDYVLKWRWTGG